MKNCNHVKAIENDINIYYKNSSFPLESAIVLEICILLVLEDNWGFIVGNCFENFKSTNVFIRDDKCLMSHNLICSSCN
jgi:hypothetical protein